MATSATDETVIESYIRENGPCLMSDDGLSYRPSERKHHPTVSFFKPSTGKGGSAFRTGGCHKGVLYHDTHSPEEVIEGWLYENPYILSENTVWAVYRHLTDGDYPDELVEAAKSILKEARPSEWPNPNGGN